MHRYFSTFAPGFGEVVQYALKLAISDVQIELLLDGLVVYKTNASTEEVKNLKFFNNTFYVLHFFKKIKRNSLPSMVKFIYQSDFLKKLSLPPIDRRTRTFRVITSKENQLGAIDLNLLKNVEDKLAKSTRLHLEKGKPDLEFWFLERAEGVGFFALRLTRKSGEEKLLQPGQLRPELVYLLCLLSDPQKEDVFLDPFAGSGAIPLGRRAFPYKRILASDSDAEKMEKLRKFETDTFCVSLAYATHLKDIEDQSIDKIVTDPPWGLADQETDIDELYKGMLIEFKRVVKSGGTIIVLTSRKLIFEHALEEHSAFKLGKKYDVLVNGKKAGVYKLAVL